MNITINELRLIIENNGIFTNNFKKTYTIYHKGKIQGTFTPITAQKDNVYQIYNNYVEDSIDEYLQS